MCKMCASYVGLVVLLSSPVAPFVKDFMLDIEGTLFFFMAAY